MPRLTDTQLRRVERALRRGPWADGFATDLWTLDRVATVIEAETGVTYHPGHVWKLLRDKLGWSRQRPARRASNATTKRSPAGSPSSGHA